MPDGCKACGPAAAVHRCCGTVVTHTEVRNDLQLIAQRRPSSRLLCNIHNATTYSPAHAAEGAAAPSQRVALTTGEKLLALVKLKVFHF